MSATEAIEDESPPKGGKGALIISLILGLAAAGGGFFAAYSGLLPIGSYITQLKPRIVDVMNTYLNALEARHFEDPVAMLKLRAQLLRRIQIVTGEGRIKDLLIMEFVLQ